MIFDRTQNDINAAISLKKRLQSGEVLASDELQRIERGTLTISTLNRIEQKTHELVELFRSVGYYLEEIPLVEWDYTDYFRETDFAVILDNVRALRNGFYVYADTPETPENNYRKYQVINDVERILHDLEAMAQDIMSRYRQCGTFECGEVNDL